MSSYADIADVKKTISIAVSDVDLDDDLEGAILAASAGIDMELGRSFGIENGTDNVRSYSPGDSYWTRILSIDDLAAFTSLRVDPTGRGDWEDWTLDTDFRLGPLNAAVGLQGWRPYTHLRSLEKRWPTQEDAIVEVTGQFGWRDLPPQIREATGLLAEKLMVRKRQAPLGFVATGNDIGAVAYIARNDPQIMGLISRLSRRSNTGSVKLA